MCSCFRIMRHPFVVCLPLSLSLCITDFLRESHNQQHRNQSFKEQTKMKIIAPGSDTACPLLSSPLLFVVRLIIYTQFTNSWNTIWATPQLHGDVSCQLTETTAYSPRPTSFLDLTPNFRPSEIEQYHFELFNYKAQMKLCLLVVSAANIGEFEVRIRHLLPCQLFMLLKWKEQLD